MIHAVFLLGGAALGGVVAGIWPEETKVAVTAAEKTGLAKALVVTTVATIPAASLPFLKELSVWHKGGA